MGREIKNAVIDSVSLGPGDGSIFSSWVQLSYGDGLFQGFGGFCLWNPSAKVQKPGNYCGLFVARILEIAGVDDWSELRGKPIRVSIIDNGEVEAVGHIIQDDWFNPSDEFSQLEIVWMCDSP